MISHIAKLSFTMAVAIVMLTAQADAQEKGTSGLVTVLDVAKVFDQNPWFKQRMEAIKGEADALKSQITKQQEQIRNEALAIQNLEVGSPDRNSKEREIEQRQADLRTSARQSEQKLLNREAEIYFETYNTMREVVSSIAQENGISLVLRYDSTEINPSNRPEVIKGVNRTVVYHRQLDLTKLVSEQMNARTASAGGNTRR